MGYQRWEGLLWCDSHPFEHNSPWMVLLYPRLSVPFFVGMFGSLAFISCARNDRNSHLHGKFAHGLVFCDFATLPFSCLSLNICNKWNTKPAQQTKLRSSVCKIWEPLCRGLTRASSDPQVSLQLSSSWTLVGPSWLLLNSNWALVELCWILVELWLSYN